VSRATDWHERLAEAIADFKKTRRSHPVVKVTLEGMGDQPYLHEAQPGPGDELVSLSVYPTGREREMIYNTKADRDYTPHVVVIHPARILRIELLREAPNAVPFGFQPSSEERRSPS